MKNIAIIPARSGSKGIRDKNIRPLNGRPLMSYTIEAALKSGIFDCVHVSTDSGRYANIAARYGADVPFLRSDELSSDTASSWDAVSFVLDRYKELGREFDLVTLLQPTSPLRNSEDIVKCMELFNIKQANAVVSVCETDHPPIFADTIAEDGNMQGFVKKEYRDMPRQAVPKYYRVNGAIYMFRAECLEHIEDLYDRGCFAYIMERRRSVDIDDEVDFDLAELLVSKNIDL